MCYCRLVKQLRRVIIVSLMVISFVFLKNIDAAIDFACTLPKNNAGLIDTKLKQSMINCLQKMKVSDYVISCSFALGVCNLMVNLFNF